MRRAVLWRRGTRRSRLGTRMRWPSWLLLRRGKLLPWTSPLSLPILSTSSVPLPAPSLYPLKTTTTILKTVVPKTVALMMVQTLMTIFHHSHHHTDDVLLTVYDCHREWNPGACPGVTHPGVTHQYTAPQLRSATLRFGGAISISATPTAAIPPYSNTNTGTWDRTKT